ncbi:MAG TPA: hypothetical protein VFC46_16425 [Humisphaera sp.]|nr:hypothetical protein [Humisphaera sp.]
MEMEQVDESQELSRRQRWKKLAFAVPLSIQTALAFVHLASSHNQTFISETVYRFFFTATFIYTAVIFAVGVLAATSMTMESLCAKIKKEDDRSRQWIRDSFKASKRFNPAYNGSFAGLLRKFAGAVCSLFYVFALAMDGFVGNATTVFFSVLLIWFGMWMVRECNRLVKEAKLKEKSRKAKERRASEEVSAISRVYGES